MTDQKCVEKSASGTNKGGEGCKGSASSFAEVAVAYQSRCIDDKTYYR